MGNLNVNSNLLLLKIFRNLKFYLSFVALGMLCSLCGGDLKEDLDSRTLHPIATI